jgi:hypothetical protein
MSAEILSRILSTGNARQKVLIHRAVASREADLDGSYARCASAIKIDNAQALP